MEALRTFVEVVESGSFSEAARHLDLPRATVSRRIARLEARLGVRLVRRSTRRMQVTPAGEAYYATVASCLQSLETTEQHLAERDAAVTGRLTVTAPVTPGSFFLGDWIGDFLQAHPEVEVDLRLTDRMEDLVESGADVALRVGPLPDTGLVARPLGLTPRFVCASPGLVDRLGLPGTPDALKAWPTIRFAAEGGDGGRQWRLRSRDGSERTIAVDGRCTVNEMNLVRRLARSGAGAAMIPEFVCREDLEAGRLVRLLPDWEGPAAPFFLVTAERTFVPRRVEAFLAFMVERARRDPALRPFDPEA